MKGYGFAYFRWRTLEYKFTTWNRDQSGNWLEATTIDVSRGCNYDLATLNPAHSRGIPRGRFRTRHRPRDPKGHHEWRLHWIVPWRASGAC